MRRAAYLVVVAGICSLPLSLARATPTLQQQYLNIYLEINDAEHLEQQGDYRGALNDFQECYNKLAKIHDNDPDWETALVVHRMEDCQTKIQVLEPKAAAQAPPAPAPPAPVAVTPAPSDTNATPNPVPPATPAPDYSGTGATPPAQPDEVSSLKLELQAVKDELNLTKIKLAQSEAQNETYRVQLKTVNEQLAALKGQESVDDRMGKLLADNKDLTEKLATARKELADIKANPHSKLALAQAQLKNLQDQYDASQEANKALQDTTTTLKQQLDQAQADLVAANQKLAAAGTASPEYATLKRENEIMRDILTRELQEQAHRDMAKRLAQEEFDNLKLKSKVLQEQLDILGSPMTPPSNDQERALLDSLKVSSPDVAQVPPTATPNGFVAQAGGTAPSTNSSTNPMAPTTSIDPNTVTTTTPATNAVAAGTPPATSPDTSTNEPPVNIVMNNPPPSGGDPVSPATSATPDTSSTNAPAAVTPPASAPAPTTTPDTAAAPPSTQTPASVPDPNNPIPPNLPPGQSVASLPVTNEAAIPVPPTPPPGPTTTQLPPAQTTYTDTTIQQGGSAPDPNDPTQYSTKARLPDDMRETAQDAADLFKNQKYDESAAKYQSIIEKYPESLYAWSNLGVVRFQQGKYEDALKALQQAVKLSPTDAFSYSNLGIVYYQLNEYENAIDALNSAKALDPNDPKTHNYLGCAESQKGWQEVAEKEFRKAIEIDPNFGDAHFNLALVYATSKPPSIELARREYNRALELGIAKDDRLEKLLGNTSSTTTTAPQQ